MIDKTIEEKELEEIQDDLTYRYELWVADLEIEKTLDEADKKVEKEKTSSSLKQNV